MKKGDQPNLLRISLLAFFALLLLAACSSPAAGDRRVVADSVEPTPIPTAVVLNKPTYNVQRGDVIHAVNLNGRISPISETTLSFAMSGQVEEVYVERGDTVLEGVEIAKLDTEELDKELVLAQTALTVARDKLAAVESIIENDRIRAELNLALAQADLDFAISQAGENPTAVEAHEITRLTILRDLAQLSVAELDSAIDPELYANVQQAELQVAELEATIADGTLLAPTDGVLLTLNLVPGRSVIEEEPVGTIAKIDALEMSVNLQPSQMSELAEGMAVTISRSNQPGETFDGYIREMPYPFGSRGSADVQSTDSSTRIAFSNPDEALQFQTGDRMGAYIVLEEHFDVLWLPPAAVRDFNGRYFVVIEDERGQSRVDIQLGIEGVGPEGDERIEILELEDEENLTEGQIIVGQ